MMRRHLMVVRETRTTDMFDYTNYFSSAACKCTSCKNELTHSVLKTIRSGNFIANLQKCSQYSLSQVWPTHYFLSFDFTAGANLSADLGDWGLAPSKQAAEVT
jgi:hypothetical protein